MNPSKQGATEFKKMFPALLILQPEQLLELIRETEKRAQ
jgi:hypothetical protein